MINWFNHLYPYTNVHELNLDIILNEIKKIEDEIKNFMDVNTIKYANPILWSISTSYGPNTVVIDSNTGDGYISLKPVPAGITLDNAIYWAKIFDFSGVIAELESKIAAIKAPTGELTLNSIIEGYSATSYINGACYIGEGKFVYYDITDNANNIGDLVCVDINTYNEVWRHSLELYHGNSITYVKDTNSLYIAACWEYGVVDLSDKVLRIDLSNPGAIAETITAPRGVYGFAYNENENVFYAICSIGADDGVANKLYIYDTHFNDVGNVLLQDYPSVLYGQSSQGVQLVHDNKVYIPFYDGSPCVYAYNLDGSVSDVYMLPATANYYRLITEVESMYYDFDRDMIGICFMSTSYYGESGLCFADTNILHDVSVRTISNIAGWFRDSSMSLSVVNGDYSNYKPSWLLGHFKVLNDLLTNMHYITSNVAVTVTGSSINKDVNIVGINNMNLSGVECKSLTIIDCNALQISNATITNKKTSHGYNTSVFVDSSNVIIYGSAINNTDYGVVSYRGAIVTVENCTFDTTATATLAFYGGTVTNIPSLMGGNSGICRMIELFNGTVEDGSTYTLNDNVDNYNTLVFAPTLTGQQLSYSRINTTTQYCNVDTGYLDTSLNYAQQHALFEIQADRKSLKLVASYQSVNGATPTVRGDFICTIYGLNQ